MVRKVGKYELGRTLGEGTFGKVKYAVHSETQEAVAIKVLDKEKIQKQNMGAQIKKEISIMKIVKHKYVVGMIEVLASKTKIFIVLELVTGGELFDKIVSLGKLTEDQALFYFCQLVEGVEYCHKLGVCHRDLKPENLLLDGQGNLKISDFGLSSLYVGDADMDGTSRTEILHTTCGTPNYVAPEVLADKGYDGKKADVWSIGVILYVLLAGFLPFDESTIVALFAKIQNADFTYPSWFSATTRGLLDTMLVADPAKRVSLTQVKDNPWVTNGMNNLETVAPPITIEPSPVQLEGAVESITENKPNSNNKDNGFNFDIDNDEENDDDDVLGSKTARGPKALNAFDLVNQCGGFMLHTMFDTSLLPITQDSKQFANKSFSTLYGTKLHDRARNMQFTSNGTAVDLIVSAFNALKELGCIIDGSADKAAGSGKIRATKLTSKGMVGLNVQTFELCSSFSLISIKRGKGDLLEWNTLYNEFYEKIVPFINISE